tara:strand:- start:1325 stop:1519 length:195 start_codon:yes stop_codon:yes gene_type:complete
MNKKKKPEDIINQIENIRKKNNVNWMNILRISFKYSPNQTARVMAKIYSDDIKISKLVKKLIKK